ncbi:MAG: GNAT family N-acetyltransferase [Candidatus Promineofilum sp.]|nr:GNAT family N-acetyltransferase [Promineifilum sp.]
MLRIIRCTSRHFDRMIDFVCRHNQAAEHHIGYFGVTPEDIRHSVLMLDYRYDRGFRLAQVGQELVGVMGVDFDRQIGRAWLYGPIVAAADWAGTADALYAAVRGAIPAGINEHEMFVDSHNLNCREYADRHNFTPKGEIAIFFITPDKLAALPEATATGWDGRYADQFPAVHDELFPNSNYTLQYILEEVGKGAVFLAEGDGDRLTGYFFGRADTESGEGYVDLVGVRNGYRGTGLGRRLMLAGLFRLRHSPGLRQVNLTVNADNDPALRLYDSLGFVKERDMMAFRKKMVQD